LKGLSIAARRSDVIHFIAWLMTREAEWKIMLSQLLAVKSICMRSDQIIKISVHTSQLSTMYFKQLFTWD
jgi:hypothetical protein